MQSQRQKYIRNFSIVAHIDHGKSTLADRLIERTGTLTKREMDQQVLDNMELEKERGITIKSQAVRLIYKRNNNEEYILNLIDTPGHVDFNYEVSRSLKACEGAILVVDATQGIQAQTLANCYLALDNDLEIVPVINKIDLASARPEEVKNEIEDVIGIESSDAPLVSAKTGLNIDDVLEAIVDKIPAPYGNEGAPLKALIFDSYYDSYRGVVCHIRVKEGTIKHGMQIKLMNTNKVYEVVETGVFVPNYMPVDSLKAGDVGYFTASIKNVRDARVGDTVTESDRETEEPLEGYRPAVPMVFSGIYPVDGAKYGELKDALEKLQVNDAALSFEPETSVALGFGFRCGFLGLLHMDIIQERIEREFNLDIITTAPSVIYKVCKSDDTVIELTNPTNLPDPSEIKYMEEPMVKASIITPSEYVGAVMELSQNRRGVFKDMQYIETTRVSLNYEIPLNEIVYDFFDVLKSRTRGYASLDYDLSGYKESKLVKLDILLNGDMVDALSMIVPEQKAYPKGRAIAEKLKEIIPRQLFEIPIQAAVGGKVIARETVKAMRKDVLAKCYGGDISRKRKLLEKQKEGKKKMRQIGTVEVPQEAFMAVLKTEE
ncbi:elongation factor 4 [Clostridium fermenticellae]|uniref:Elongation factor 4 n=1 Tax=Clostridium fermenticellae TaxID=2068654 RepID=A0A386H5G4_9CLOT|nr:translation elongation factor 4 [Clostridium fermenticellae]AYD40991.1 elongation factor 4 [Clostridium fermenticellae]